ncbi:MAG: hypothetical protein JWQ08_2592 [Deinococcus sp.]|nr:hypothetical protein [Deinococcus sp.]
MARNLRFEVHEASGIGAARRGAAELASALGFSASRVSDVSIAVTELASNLVKHTPDGGEVLISVLPTAGLEVLALDRGAGLAQPGEVLRDGYSTAGTSGTGLGAVVRLATEFGLYSAPGKGTAVLARFAEGAGPPGPASLFDVGAVHVPHPREQLNGDGWTVQVGPVHARILLVDGLGHGLLAFEAAQAALTSFGRTSHLAPSAALEAVHSSLRQTRGAVGAVAELDLVGRVVRFSGVGNITGALVDPTGRRGLVSHNGTLGQEARKFAEYTLPWPHNAVLVLHSDGLSALWNLEKYPGLLRKPAALIAAVLYRDFSRGRDDATVVVVREAI